MPARNQPRPEESPERGWGLRDIQKLIDVLVKRKITEFEMEKDGLKVRIKRGNSHWSEPATSSGKLARTPASASNPAPAPVLPAAPTPTVSEALHAEPAEELHIIKSPMVGTFYAASAPNAPPFVSLGDTVQVGQVVCIIEAMKLMNEIEADVAGEVVRIYLENGQPVEYGQSLFAINPSHKR